MNYQIILYLMTCCIMIFCNSCDAQSKPDQEYPWKESDEKGFMDWGCGGVYMYGLAGLDKNSNIIGIWKYDDGIFKKMESKVLNKHDSYRIVYHKSENFVQGLRLNEKSGKAGVAIKNNKLNVVQKWDAPKGWYCSRIDVGRNGNYIAVTMAEDSTYSDDYDRKRPRLLFGTLGPKLDQIYWLPHLQTKFPSGPKEARRTTISDDGAYIAVAGWMNGAAVIDVINKKTLWQRRPKEEAMLRDIDFTPDNKLVYAGGTIGYLYGMDIKTGKVVSKWPATPSGKTDYGRRIDAVSVSPDGKYVAAGFAPSGYIKVFYTQTGKVAKTMRHGSGILMMMFTPDSKSLASFDGGTIKVWNMPENTKIPQ